MTEGFAGTRRARAWRWLVVNCAACNGLLEESSGPEPDEYSYSYDEEYWHGGFSSHEDALAEGLSDLCEERSTIYTARTVRRDVDADDYEGDGYPIDTYDVREHDVPEDEDPQAMGHLCSYVMFDGVRLCRHCGQTHESQMVDVEQIRAVLEKFRR